MRSRRAFTLLELLMTVAIIAIVAAIVIPRSTGDERLRAMAAAAILRSDIELAQVMTISYPDDPVIVRIDTDNGEYWLASSDAPDTPILREDTGEPYVVTFGVDRGVTAQGVEITTDDLADNTIAFNASGGLEDFSSSPSIRLQAGEEWIELDIAATTGRITETAGSDA